MIEITLLNYLNSKITDIPIYTEIPKNAPERFYLIEKTSSSRTDHLWSSTIAVQSYGSSLYIAASMSEDIRDLILDDFINDEDSVSKVSLNSEYNFTDTAEKRYRYQAVFDIIHI